MADLYRRLPVLLLVVILLVVVVLFHMCISLKVPGRTHRRRSAKKGVDMDDWQPKSRALFDSPTAHHAQHSGARKSQQYHPSAYVHIPSHEIPLPPTDDEAEEVIGRRSGGGGVDATFAVDVDERTGRQVWEEHRQQLRGDREDAIMRVVRQLHVGISDADKEATVEVDNFEDINEEGENDEEAVVDIRPVGRTSMGGRGRSKKASAAHGRGTKKTASSGSDGELQGDMDVNGERNFWLVEHMVALVRAKQNQDGHLEGMGHTFARMKPREWKWQDVHERLKKVGVARSDENCGKKWDNLMQQFKKVHRFMQECGKPDYFQLTGKERRSHRFNFVMERVVYEEIKGSTAKNHTIHPRNVTDTNAPGGVEMWSGSGRGRGDGGGGGDESGEPHEEEDGSTKGSSFSTCSTAGLAMRQQTFEALTDVMEKHGTLMATALESASKRQ
ncbi:hypothetical protein CBR_g21012 [Chara braunii]|uniref:Myb/SANT-like DNA-binding domain-containing protein n=1 Tax=Chara braunii TaxID=69332 RepID=A0A388L0H3_CHABU|nr:hypothetical protein CBR_g21012 [Chara braunii]|eukprot:GBG75768.1 hypothetical protein CBR_g21012 [Chara braunii]